MTFWAIISLQKSCFAHSASTPLITDSMSFDATTRNSFIPTYGLIVSFASKFLLCQRRKPFISRTRIFLPFFFCLASFAGFLNLFACCHSTWKFPFVLHLIIKSLNTERGVMVCNYTPPIPPWFFLGINSQKCCKDASGIKWDTRGWLRATGKGG